MDNNLNKKIAQLNAHKAINMFFDDYEKDSLLRREAELNAIRVSFIQRYTVENIRNMTLEEYCIGNDSFCRKIRFDLQGLASMGNAYPDTFGIYFKKETDEVELSRTYDKLSEHNKDVAFSIIKREIIKLIEEFPVRGFDVIHDIHLNKMYIYKLLIIYYPDSVFPVCAKGTMRQYCESVGIDITDKEEISDGMKKLLNWKAQARIFDDWSNDLLMRFTDWLISSGNCIDGNELIEDALDDNKNGLIKHIESFDDVTVKKFNGINKYHLKYKGNGFAVLNLNQDYYNLRAPERVIKIFTTEYNLTENYGRNNCIVNRIIYDDTSLLDNIILYSMNKQSDQMNIEWIPSLIEYNPDISKDEYKRIVRENIKWADTIYYMYILGGESTCSEISIRFGKTPGHYNRNAINLAQAIQSTTNCDVYSDARYGGYWTLLFYGRITHKRELGAFKWKLREALEEAIIELEEEGLFDMYKKSNITSNTKFPLNMILYGPPGTGKTYNSILYAVAICEGTSIEELQAEDYSKVIDRFKRLRNEGRIAFTTFHQSYGYEEFIEGIKPIIDDSDDGSSDIDYSIEDGIFKNFCERASLPIGSSESVDIYGLNKNPVVWKVSLGGTGDNPTRTDCLENDHIRIGWEEYGEVITDDTDFTNGGKIVLNSFINKMKVGDIVLSCYSASSIDAIGVVTGEYEWHPEFSVHKRLRKVRWLAKNINYNILELNNNTSMTLATVYKMKIAASDVFKILNDLGISDKASKTVDNEPFVFIIDEINRGNISKIFGELITLIEPTKRIGKLEELKVELPYSKKQFGVPNNVYILGTMNTADRSIALMDTALRRRFEFIEMMPDCDVLQGVSVEQDGETVDIAKMLSIINLRIEYLYDREHTIGHAYFMELLKTPTIEVLAEIFDKNLIPLLKEYFYEDYGKIQMILGDNKKSSDDYKFIKETKLVTKDIFNGDTSELDLPEQIYSIQKDALFNIHSYKEISKDL